MAERKPLPFSERCRALAKECRVKAQSFVNRRKANLAFSTLLVILVADQTANPFGPPPPVLTPDGIRAAREKQDLEMKSDTKRPWDGMELTGPNAFQKKQPAESSGQGNRGDR